jgi:hypothetical protein
VSDWRQPWQNALQPSPDCIAIDRLGGELSDRERDHLAKCPRCQAEMALFDAFNSESASPDEIREGRWMVSELHRRLDAPSNVKPFQSRRRPVHVLAAAAVVVIVAGAAYWMDHREPELSTGINVQSVYRTSRLDVIAPLGSLPKIPQELKWRRVARATSYSVQMLEIDRTLLWSAETAGESIPLPADVMARCAPGKSILWEVKARRGSEVLASSGTQRFHVVLSPAGRTR